MTIINSSNTKYNSLYLDPKFRLKIRSSSFDNIMYSMDNKEFKENKGKIDDKFYALKYEDTDIVHYETKFSIEIINIIFLILVLCYDVLIPLTFINYDIIDILYSSILIDILIIIAFFAVIKPFLCFLNMKYINFRYRKHIYIVDNYDLKIICLSIIVLLIGFIINGYVIYKYIDFTNKISVLYEEITKDKFNIYEFKSLDKNIRYQIYERITHPELYIENNKEEQRKMEINEIYYNFLRSL